MIDFTAEVSPELWATLRDAVDRSGLIFDEFLAMALLNYLGGSNDL